MHRLPAILKTLFSLSEEGEVMGFREGSSLGSIASVSRSLCQSVIIKLNFNEKRDS